MTRYHAGSDLVYVHVVYTFVSHVMTFCLVLTPTRSPVLATIPELVPQRNPYLLGLDKVVQHVYTSLYKRVFK